MATRRSWSRRSMGGIRAGARASFWRTKVGLGHDDCRILCLGLPLVTSGGRWEGVDWLRRPLEIDVGGELTDGRWMSGVVKWERAFGWLTIRGLGERSAGEPVFARESLRDVERAVALSVDIGRQHDPESERDLIPLSDVGAELGPVGADVCRCPIGAGAFVGGRRQADHETPGRLRQGKTNRPTTAHIRLAASGYFPVPKNAGDGSAVGAGFRHSPRLPCRIPHTDKSRSAESRRPVQRFDRTQRRTIAGPIQGTCRAP